MKGRLLRYNCRWLKFIFLYLFTSLVSAQSEIKVINEEGEALIGVYIYTQQNVYTTDISGICTINNPIKDSSIIRIEYVGYKDLSISFKEIKESDFTVKMAIDPLLLEEIIVVGRTNAKNIDLPYRVERIDSEEILKSNAQTSADALELNSGAYIQKSQMGGGSPVLRGFEANKVLLVVDGVRLNNAIYRNGHLQNAITIDASILDQMEIIFGAGSLLYGSEALGGVVHFRTKSPLLNFNDQFSSKQSLSSYLRYNTSNQEKKVHLDYSYGNSNWGVLTSLSFADYNDLRAGSQRREDYPNFGLRNSYVDLNNNQDIILSNENPNIQIGTAYSQWDFLQKWIFKFSEYSQFNLNIQYSSSSDIPRYDNLSELRNGTLRFAEWYYGPQNRLLIAPSLQIKKETNLFDEISFIGSFQKIDEDRISRRLNNTRREHQEEDVQVIGFTVDFKKRLNAQNKLVYGADIHHNIVASEAFTVDAYTEDRNMAFDILSRYPSDGSSLTNYGFFLQHNWQNKDSSIVWINGLRWSGQDVLLQYDRNDPIEWPEYFYNGIKSNNSALVGISGLNIRKGPWLLKMSTGSSFRSPNVDDLAKIRVNADEITIPNPELKAEKVWNNEINISYTNKSLKLTASTYYTLLDNAIVRTSFQLPDGSSNYMTSGDTLRVTANVNAAQGNIRGLALAGTYHFNKHLRIDASINFQKGLFKDENNRDSPLGHIPPTFGSNKITFTKDKWDFELTHRFNMWKRIEDFGGSVDNPELATVDGSPSWHILGLTTNYHLSQHWRFNLAFQNIFDIHYRPFSSGLSAAGRHMSIAVYYNWQKG